MRFLDRHHFENVDNAPGKNIEERSIGMGDMHPAVTIMQQLHIRINIRIFQFQQMLLDDPAILVRQTVSVLYRSLFEVYTDGVSLFSGLRIRDRCQAKRILLPLRSCQDVE